MCEAPNPTRRAFIAGVSCALTLSLPLSARESSTLLPETAPLAAPAGRLIALPGARVHVLEAGTGIPVVLIHGANGNLRDWALGPMQAVARRYRALALDRPGHGFTDRIAGAQDPAVQAGLLDRALDRLGVGRAILVGHSYGGSVALAWALAHPARVAGLVLLSAPSHVWPGSAGGIYDWLRLPVAGGALALLAPLVARERMLERAAAGVFAPQRPPADYVARMGARLAVRPASVRANGADINALKEHLGAMTGEYPRLRLPVEILHGTRDTIVGLTIHSVPLAQAVPGARLVTLDGVGHMPHHVRTREMMLAIDRVALAAGMRG